MNKIKGFFGTIYAIPFVQAATEANVQHERLLHEIAVLAKITPDEVQKFYQEHSYSLELIKQVVSTCGVLNEDAFVRMAGAFSPFAELYLTNLSIKPTLKERISNMPQYVAYRVAYPFLWFVCEIWRGIRDAWSDTFDEY